jgi:hypothetical protein
MQKPNSQQIKCRKMKLEKKIYYIKRYKKNEGEKKH